VPDYGRGKRPLDKPTRREERMRDDRDAIQRALDRFTNPKIRTLMDRGDRGVRGSIDGERVGSSKGDVPRPTERVALEGLPDDDETPDVWRERRDAVGRCIRDVAGLLDTARQAMEAAEDRLVWVLGLKPVEGELVGQHKTAGVCRACQRTVTGSDDDRLRSGYCDACRKAWGRELSAWTDEGRPGAPDRAAFERRRLVAAEEEKRAS
jgi:hypothetical protein